MKKLKISSKELDDAAIDYLSVEYKRVREKIKTGSYPKEWDVIMQSFKAGFYVAVSKLKKLSP